MFLKVALDPAGRDVYCETCHAQLFAVRCAECGDPISPASGATTAPRLTALGRDFHPDCFRCSDCRHGLHILIVLDLDPS